MLGQATGKFRLTKFTTAQTWNHHLPLYSILCASPRGPHLNGILSQDSQMGVPKFSNLGLFQLWGPITFSADLLLRWDSNQSCSPYQDLSNGMWHTICTPRNRNDSRLLVVESQTVNLTPSPSFGHNLCIRCPNGSCEPIFDIYVPRVFQWYKKRLNLMNFDPWNFSLKIRESNWDSNSQNGSSLESVRVHSLTLFCTPRSMRCDSRPSLLARILANPCLGHEPKARVVTLLKPSSSNTSFIVFFPICTWIIAIWLSIATTVVPTSSTEEPTCFFMIVLFTFWLFCGFSFC
jgi:hypothetical protein